MRSRIGLNPYPAFYFWRINMKFDNENDRKRYKYVTKPFIIYTIINLIFMFLSCNNIGVLNEDTFGGLFISWIINGLVTYITICTHED